VRWHDAELVEEKAPRLEITPGGGTCNAVGYNREGATIVGASVNELGQGNNQWIFAVRDAALPRVDYMQRDGLDSGDDRVLALACDYMCAWAGHRRGRRRPEVDRRAPPRVAVTAAPASRTGPAPSAAPSSKEGAVVVFADGQEAAVRGGVREHLRTLFGVGPTSGHTVRPHC
jgi:hypothetical protein